MVSLNLLGVEELDRIFEEMRTAQQKKIIMQGLTKAGNIIKKEGIQGYMAAKKSATNKYTDRIRKSFKTKPSKINQLEVITGSPYYLANWINTGTDNRVTKGRKGRAKHNTGKVNATYFWKGAVDRKMDEAQGAILQNIESSLQRIIKKNAVKSK